MPNGRFAQLRIVGSSGHVIETGPKFYANGTEDLALFMATRALWTDVSVQIYQNSGSTKDICSASNSDANHFWGGVIA